jgi:ABC-type transport system substrate-binding protein
MKRQNRNTQFTLDAAEPGRLDELARADGSTAHADRLTYELGLADEEIERRFLAGEISYVKDPPRSLVERIDADPEAGQVLRAVQLHTERLIFDCAYPPFDTPEVRRAVSLAIDKARYVREAHGDGAVPAAGPIPPGLLGHETGYGGLDHDPDRARALLAKAGFASGLKTSVWFTPGFVTPVAVERIRHDLSAVGVEAEMREVDPEEFARARARGVIPIAWRSWFADYADPDNFTYVLFHSSNERFFSSNYRNEEFDRLSERARGLMDREDRDALYRRLGRLLVEDAPSVFLLHRRVVVAHRPEVEGLRLHLLTPVVRPAEVWLSE